MIKNSSTGQKVKSAAIIENATFTRMDTEDILGEAFGETESINSEVSNDMNLFTESVFMENEGNRNGMGDVNTAMAIIFEGGVTSAPEPKDEEIMEESIIATTSSIMRLLSESENAPEPKNDDYYESVSCVDEATFQQDFSVNAQIDKLFEAHSEPVEDRNKALVEGVLAEMDDILNNASKPLIYKFPRQSSRNVVATIEQDIMDEFKSEYGAELIESMLNEAVENKDQVLEKLNAIITKPDGDKQAEKFVHEIVKQFIASLGAGASASAISGGNVVIGVLAASATFLVWVISKVATMIAKKQDAKNREASLKALLKDTDDAIAAAEKAGKKKEAAQLKAVRSKVESEMKSVNESVDIADGETIDISKGDTVSIADGMNCDVTNAIYKIIGGVDKNDPISDTGVDWDTNGIINKESANYPFV